MTEVTAPGPRAIELKLPARAEVVSLARLVVGAAAAIDPSFDDDRGSDLRLALSEACTNAIRAQRRAPEGSPGVDEPIVVQCHLGDGEIVITVRDHGGGFDPDAVSPLPPAADPDRLDHEGGLGIPLMTLLADDVSFERFDGGTVVRMKFGPDRPEGKVE